MTETLPPTLSPKDVRILEEIGNKSIFKTKKKLVLNAKQNQLRKMKQQWEKNQTQ